MTAPATVAAQHTTCRAVAPPCNPTTLGDLCAGGCGRPLHTRERGATRRTACADGHPALAARGLCDACTSRARRRRASTTTPPRTADQTWRQHAACRGADPNQFFPDIPAGANFTRIVEPVAARYCARCPVAAACDTYAEATRSLGLWAGTWRRYRGSTYTRTRLTARRDAAS